MSNDPLRDCLKAAWAAALKGDMTGRDRILARGYAIADAQKQPPEIKMERGADGVYRPALKKH